MDSADLLRIYLRDHHAAAVALVEVVKRAASSNEGTSFEPLLNGLREEVREDLATLESIMERLGISPAKGKDGAAWVMEKMGRLKLNGSLTQYSPLSRVVELEGIALGIQVTMGVWRSLRELNHDLLQTTELEALEARSDDQRRRVEEARSEAALIAFGGVSST